MIHAGRIAHPGPRRRRPVLAAAVAALLLAPSAAAAQGFLQAVVPVRGMTCVLCTRGVEESIKRLDGVGVVMADLESARVRVEALPGKSLSLQQVKDGVQRAGFGIGGEITLLAPGRFAIGPERRLTFRVSGAGPSYQVLESSQLLRLFKRHPGLRGEFLVDFRLHDHPHWRPAAISILSFAPRPKPAATAGR